MGQPHHAKVSIVVRQAIILLILYRIEEYVLPCYMVDMSI